MRPRLCYGPYFETETRQYLETRDKEKHHQNGIKFKEGCKNRRYEKTFRLLRPVEILRPIRNKASRELLVPWNRIFSNNSLLAPHTLRTFDKFPARKSMNLTTNELECYSAMKQDNEAMKICKMHIRGCQNRVIAQF